MEMQNNLLRENQVADILNVSVKTLRTWRQLGRGPAIIKISSRCVRYSQSSIHEFCNQFKQEQTKGVINMAKKKAKKKPTKK